MKALFVNWPTWAVAAIISLLSFMWTQSGRISALEATAASYQQQMNRVEAKIDYLLEHQK